MARINYDTGLKLAWISLFLLIMSACGGMDGAGGAAEGQESDQAFDHGHGIWNELLVKHVRQRGASTVFDYSALKQDPSGLIRYLERLQGVAWEQFDAWSDQRRLAFLINAYNAYTIQLIVDNYPLASIREISQDPWEEKSFPLLGQKRSLNEIEHTLIRGAFQEPRIHFAVNCAAASCPPLRGEAFIADRLEEQLQDSTVRFLADRENNRVDEDEGAIYLSSIFQWYGEDFEQGGGVLAFAASLISSDPGIQARIKSGQLDLRYLEYDWALNDAQP